MARYDAFLLRIWRTGAGSEGRWAIRLEHLPDGQGARLDSLEALIAHLAAVVPDAPVVPDATGYEKDSAAPTPKG